MDGALTIEMYADWSDRSDRAKARYFHMIKLVRFMIQLNMLHNVYLVDTNDRSRSIKIAPWRV